MFIRVNKIVKHIIFYSSHNEISKHLDIDSQFIWSTPSIK